MLLAHKAKIDSTATSFEDKVESLASKVIVGRDRNQQIP
jgi:hypothetical protein